MLSQEHGGSSRTGSITTGDCQCQYLPVELETHNDDLDEQEGKSSCMCQQSLSQEGHQPAGIGSCQYFNGDSWKPATEFGMHTRGRYAGH